MNRKISEKFDIFAIDLSDVIIDSKDGCFLIFSPVTNDAFYVTDEGLKKLNQELSTESLSPRIFHDFIQNVRNSPIPHGYNLAKGTGDVCYLSISPTARCNFRCPYCYAKEEHENRYLSSDRMIAVCDCFITGNRAKNGMLIITFLGGGEPLLEAPEVAKTIKFIRDKANRLSITVKIGIISNMSLCTDEIIDFLVENNVVVTASFEILRDVQNTQREKYDIVSENLKKFLKKGGFASIRGTITDLNVSRQEEMVTELIHFYPEIKDAAFEPVTDFSSFGSPADYSSFVEVFLSNFETARKRAEKSGVSLNCSFYRRIDVTEQRFCPPEWNLTSRGELTVCHRLSGEKNTFGFVDEHGNVVVDEKVFRQVVNEDTGRKPECRYCFAKWNCGGGCRAQNIVAPVEFRHANCDLFRSFLKRQLIMRLNNGLREKGVLNIPTFNFEQRNP